MDLIKSRVPSATASAIIRRLVSNFVDTKLRAALPPAELDQLAKESAL